MYKSLWLISKIALKLDLRYWNLKYKKHIWMVWPTEYHRSDLGKKTFPHEEVGFPIITSLRNFAHAEGQQGRKAWQKSKKKRT